MKITDIGAFISIGFMFGFIIGALIADYCHNRYYKEARQKKLDNELKDQYTRVKQEDII
jgi:uncharacterized membrane-anchored protein YhcB (DUF1043 family)